MSMTTAREIAEAAGLVKSSIMRRAEKESWPFEEIAQRGGRQRHYALTALPAELQAAVRKHRGLQAAQRVAVESITELRTNQLLAIQQKAETFAESELEKTVAENRARLRRKEDGLAQFNALTEGDKKQRARARRYLIEMYWEHFRKVGGSREAARALIADSVNTGTLQVPAEFADFMPQYNGTRTLTEATLHRWELTFLDEGIFGLVDKHGHRKNCSTIETTPELLKVVLGCMIKHPHITAKKIKQYLEAAHAALDIVSEKSIQRFKTTWIETNHQLWTYLTNPDRWKNVYMAAVGSQHENVERLNQIWEMDSTPADWMLTDGRHSVVGAIDLYSRRLMFFVSKTSSAYAVCQTFRRAVLAWGKPEAIRTDNGKDYVSVHFNSVLDDLEIGHELCVPFASEEKGTVERAMRTMSHGILDLLPGFIGHNVAERKQIEARKSFSDRIMKPGEVIDLSSALSAAELQQKLDDWCEHLYGKDAHSGLAGQSPWAVANAWLKPIRRIDNVRALDALLAPVDGVRVIGKKGIRLDHHEYFAPELFEHVGEPAVLKLDESDIGRVYVYVHEQFLCIAECPELLGISRHDKASAIKHGQKKLLREQSAEYKQLTRDMTENIADAVIRHRIETSDNVAELPKRAEEYTTPALQQAGRSLQRTNVPQQDESIAAAAAITLNNIFTIEPRATSELQQVIERNDACEMYLHWLAVQRRNENGERLSDEETRWFASFPLCAHYRTGKILADMRQQTA